MQLPDVMRQTSTRKQGSCRFVVPIGFSVAVHMHSYYHTRTHMDTTIKFLLIPKQ